MKTTSPSILSSVSGSHHDITPCAGVHDQQCRQKLTVLVDVADACQTLPVHLHRPW